MMKLSEEPISLSFYPFLKTVKIHRLPKIIILSDSSYREKKLLAHPVFSLCSAVETQAQISSQELENLEQFV